MDRLRRRVVGSLPPLRRRDQRIADLDAQLARARETDAPPAEDGPGRTADTQSVDTGSWEPPRGRAARELLLSSSLFDEDWYRARADELGTLPAFEDVPDPVVHFLRHGAPAGVSCHPGFSVGWYLAKAEADGGVATPRRRMGRSPVLHYLTVGVGRALSPHPALDAGAYLDANPEARAHPGGALGHAASDDAGPVPGVAVPGTVLDEPVVWRSPAEFDTLTRQVGQELSATHGYRHLPRESTTFDADAERRVKESLRAQDLPGEPPLVSIVLPTKDRARSLPATLDSVLAQTYTSWELLVVDDGSGDDTARVLAEYDDPRIVVTRHDRSRGVAAARNTALAAARGRWVAYIDSDNTWRPDFLDSMARFLLLGGHQVAYAASALVESGGRGRRRYRGMPFSRGALRERNYIDCIALVHERSLLEQTGGFDETLRRTVDWDLMLRLADVVDFAYLPVIATEYDVWDVRGDRISTQVSVGYRSVVQQRALLDIDEVRTRLPDRVSSRTSVVLTVTDDAPAALDTVRRCLATATGDLELVVVDVGASEAGSTELATALHDLPQVVLVRLAGRASTEVARNVGAARSSGEHLVFLPAGAWCEPGWEASLTEALTDHAVVQPLVLRRGGTVWSAGVFLRDDGRGTMAHRGVPGDAPEVRGTRVVDGAAAVCTALSARTFVELGGFDPMAIEAWSGAELSLRASDATGLGVACVGDAVVALLREPYSDQPGRLRLRHRGNDRVQAAVWAGRPSLLRDRLETDGLRIVGHGPDESGDPDGRPLLVRDRPGRPLRWAIKIGPPDVPGRENWGDWHFAEALRDSLERVGDAAVVDSTAEWYRPTSHLDDVSLVLRGLSYYDPAPDHLNLHWVISHPDRVTVAELDGFDAVFAASQTWSSAMTRRLGREVVPLLQCTDQHRFAPVPPDPARAHDVLAVANARGVRPSVAAALSAGIVPAVYGARWDGLLPDGAWKGRYIPNDELVSYYVSAGVVLNDHHEDMRDEGFLSNRLFDLAACGARVLSDDVPGLSSVFGDVVSTYGEPGQIPALVREHLAETPQRREQRLELSARVREVHTFDARAAQLADTARRLLHQRDAGGPRTA